MDEIQILQHARELIRQGDRVAARSLLHQAIQINPRSEVAWLWLSAIVDSPLEEKECLQKVLEINPNNELAHRHLAKPKRSELANTIRKNLTNLVLRIVIMVFDACVIGGGLMVAAGIGFAVVGVPVLFALLLGAVVGCVVSGKHLSDILGEWNRSRSISPSPKELVLVAALSGIASGTGSTGSSPSSPIAVFPSGYSREQYHQYGATDADIEFWELDQPGAPEPQNAGWAIMDLMDEIDRDGDGLIDD